MKKLLTLTFVLTAFATRAASVTLAWDAAPGAVGYRLYWGTASQTYNYMADVGSATSATVTNLNAGTAYYFAVTAYNSVGLESPFSSEVVCTTASAPPLLTLKRTPGRSVLSWPTNYAGYALQSRASLTNQWTTLTTNAPRVGLVFSYNHNTTAPRMFYRLKK